MYIPVFLLFPPFVIFKYVLVRRSLDNCTCALVKSDNLKVKIRRINKQSLAVDVSSLDGTGAAISGDASLLQLCNPKVMCPLCGAAR